jgi:hypothetical protein
MMRNSHCISSNMLIFGSCSLVSTRISRQNGQQEINNLEVFDQLENKVFFLFNWANQTLCILCLAPPQDPKPGKSIGLLSSP